MNGILINVRVTLTWTRPKKIISNYHIVSTPFDDLLLRATLTWTLCSLRAAAGARSPSRRTGGSRSRWSRWPWDLSLEQEIFCVPLLGWHCEFDSIMVIEETNVYCSLFLLKKCFPFFGNAVIAGSERNMICTWRLYQCLIWCRTIFKRDYFPNPFSRVPFYVEFRL